MVERYVRALLEIEKRSPARRAGMVGTESVRSNSKDDRGPTAPAGGRSNHHRRAASSLRGCPLTTRRSGCVVARPSFANTTRGGRMSSVTRSCSSGGRSAISRPASSTSGAQRVRDSPQNRSSTSPRHQPVDVRRGATSTGDLRLRLSRRPRERRRPRRREGTGVGPHALSPSPRRGVRPVAELPRVPRRAAERSRAAGRLRGPEEGPGAAIPGRPPVVSGRQGRVHSGDPRAAPPP